MQVIYRPGKDSHIPPQLSYISITKKSCFPGFTGRTGNLWVDLVKGSHNFSISIAYHSLTFEHVAYRVQVPLLPSSTLKP